MASTAPNQQPVFSLEISDPAGYTWGVELGTLGALQVRLTRVDDGEGGLPPTVITIDVPGPVLRAAVGLLEVARRS
jgi:hypothetical protein